MKHRISIGVANALQYFGTMETNAFSKNPTQIIRDDHRRLIGLFRQSEAAPLRAPETQNEIYQEIFAEIEIHSQIEEKVFYPELLAAADEMGDGRLRSWLEQGIENHQWIDQAVRGLKVLDSDSESFGDQFAELRERFETHLHEEEQEVLPNAEKLILKRGEEIAKKMRSFRKSGAPGIQAPNGGEQKRTVA